MRTFTKFHKLATFCQQKVIEQKLLQISESAYTLGNSALSISKHIGSHTDTAYPNYYIHRDISHQISEPVLEKSVFRLILSAGLGKQTLNFQINQLRAHPIIKQLTALNQDQKYRFQSSRIIIEDPISMKIGEQILDKNIKEIEKLFEDGFGLSVAFMISGDNVENQGWIKILSKKRKAISSSILQLLSNKSSAKPHSLKFEELVYDQGYKIQHIFLKGYNKKGQVVDKLADSDAIDMNQLLNVLKMISFKGKIVLDCQSFEENVLFLHSALKKFGYSMKHKKQFQKDNWFLFI